MRWLVVLVVLACGDDAGELGPELGGAELEQAAPPVDCRPVRRPNCANAWNDRACFSVPAECANARARPGPSPDP